jgi:diacylglycerol kinase (ATP)
MDRAVPAAVFVNPAAGRGGAAEKIAPVRSAFLRRNYPVTIVETGSAKEFQTSVRAAIREGCATLIALGGDGTMQLLAREAIGRGVRIGVIPAGGGNDFAAALGIPGSLPQAADLIVRGKARAVDAVEVRTGAGTPTEQDAVYLGGGGLGLDAEAIRYANGRFLPWPGRLRYLASAIAALGTFPGLEVEAEFPGGESPKIVKTVLLAAVLNTPTMGGGLRLAPAARADDGRLELVMIEMLPKSEVLRLLPRLLFTGELKTKRVLRVCAEKVRLSTREQAWFQGDGELLGISPVEIRVLRNALCVLTP